MAIDPPYRLDPLQNPVNVKWTGEGSDTPAINEIFIVVSGAVGVLLSVQLNLAGHAAGANAFSNFGGNFRWVTALDIVTDSSPITEAPYSVHASSAGLVLTASVTDASATTVCGPINQNYGGQQVRDVTFPNGIIYTAADLGPASVSEGQIGALLRMTAPP